MLQSPLHVFLFWSERVQVPLDDHVTQKIEEIEKSVCRADANSAVSVYPCQIYFHLQQAALYGAILAVI